MHRADMTNLIMLSYAFELARQSRNPGFGLSWEESPGSTG